MCAMIFTDEQFEMMFLLAEEFPNVPTGVISDKLIHYCWNVDNARIALSKETI